MAMPALRSVSEAADVDVAIVGAGAAGIAAARRLAAAGRRVVLLEAAASPGGRCITDTRMFGLPYDLGAHWLHAPDINPVAKLAPRTGLDVYPAPPGQKLRIGRRNAREGEMEDFLGGLVRAQRAIAEAARGKTDSSCAQALPRDLGEWRPSVEFVLGPFGCGKDLSEISALDFAKSAERNIEAYCRQGLGTLLAKLADGLTIELATPATLIDARSIGIQIETGKGRFGARAVIVTPSTNVLASGAIKFMPDLPKRQLDALSKLTLGTYERIALELAGNPLGLQRDDLVFEKAQNIRTAALLANVSGTTLSYVDVGGKFARELAPRGRRGHGGVRVGMARRAIRQRPEKIRAPQPRDAMEQGALDTRRSVGGGARRAAFTPRADGAGARAHLFCRRSGARDHVGHFGRRLGIGRACGGRSTQIICTAGPSATTGSVAEAKTAKGLSFRRAKSRRCASTLPL